MPLTFWWRKPTSKIDLECEVEVRMTAPNRLRRESDGAGRKLED